MLSLSLSLSLSPPCMHRYSVKENLRLKSEEDIISELKIYKNLGGGTICDVTSIGIR